MTERGPDIAAVANLCEFSNKKLSVGIEIHTVLFSFN